MNTIMSIVTKYNLTQYDSVATGKQPAVQQLARKTLGAVKEFQKVKNLVIDGIVGPKTWEALG